MAHASTPGTSGPHAPEDTGPATDREFASALARLAIEMPADLAPGVLAGNRSLRAMSRLLRNLEATDV